MRIPMGDTVKDELKYLKIKQWELASMCGVTEKHMCHVLSGKARLSYELAYKIERATGLPATLLLNLDYRYYKHEFRKNRL